MIKPILATALIVTGLMACKLPSRASGDNEQMAIFGEAATAGVQLTIQIEVPRDSGRAKWIDAEPLLWVADRLHRAELAVDNQGLEMLRLWFTPAGARQFEEITSRYKQRNLFFLHPMPDPLQPGKTKPCCVGTFRVDGIVASRVIDVIPNASHEELKSIVDDLNQRAGVK